MATYKMLSDQRGVRPGDVHSVLFHQGKTYEIDDDLAGEFRKLEAIEPSNEEPVEALPEDGREDLHENWLDTDPAVLRHGELTAEQVVAKDESPYSEGQQPAEQVEGKAEGDEHAGDDHHAEDGEVEGDDADGGKSGRARKSK